MANTRPRPLHAYFKADASVLPEELRCHADEFTLLQHRILTRRWLRYTDRSGDFTILKREIINEELTQPIASKLLTWGKQAGVLHCDGQYIVNEKSFGYRLADALERLPTQRRPLTSERLIERIRAFEHRDSRNYTKAHRHLKRWLHAISFAPEAMETARRCSASEAAREANEGAVRLLLDGQFSFGVCDYGRVHTSVTRLFRPLRRHLFLEGEPLVNIDIANSQPLFLAIALLQSNGNVTLPLRGRDEGSSVMSPLGVPRLDMRSLPVMDHCETEFHSDKQDGFWQSQPQSPTAQRMGYSSPIRCRNEKILTCNYLLESEVIADSKMPKLGVSDGTKSVAEVPDVLDYLTTCQNGGLYRQVMDGIGWQHGKDSFKSDVWFHFLYGSNKSPERLSKPDLEGLRALNLFFSERWPTVYQHIWSMKEKNYKTFSRSMQRSESALMIDGVGAKLAAEYPEIPVLSIHDSYLTPQQHVGTVKQLIYDEFAKLGITPTLGEENYAKRTDYDSEHFEGEETPEEDCRRR